MSTLYTQQGANVRKTWVLMAAFLVLIIGVGYLAAYFFGNPAILYIATGFA